MVPGTSICDGKITTESQAGTIDTHVSCSVPGMYLPVQIGEITIYNNGDGHKGNILGPKIEHNSTRNFPSFHFFKYLRETGKGTDRVCGLHFATSREI